MKYKDYNGYTKSLETNPERRAITGLYLNLTLARLYFKYWRSSLLFWIELDWTQLVAFREGVWGSFYRRHPAPYGPINPWHGSILTLCSKPTWMHGGDWSLEAVEDPRITAWRLVGPGVGRPTSSGFGRPSWSPLPSIFVGNSWTVD